MIDAILEGDSRVPRKQRHTAKRVFERLKDEYGFDGQYTIVKDYVRERGRRTQEMFVPLSHAPGHAQCDFGEAVALIAGVERKVHYFVLDLPHSDGCFVKAYPAETTEAFLDGHVSAFALLGGAPQSILYDNTKLAVARILGDGRRKRTRAFTELQSHYLFEDRFGRPGKGNDKGKVEGMVGYARRNFLVPVPRVESFEALNAHLEQRCLERMDATLRGHTETIGQRMERDLDALLPLPAVPYDAGDKQPSRVSSLSLVRYRTNDYSAPVAYGHRYVLVRGYVDRRQLVPRPRRPCPYAAVYMSVRIPFLASAAESCGADAEGYNAGTVLPQGASDVQSIRAAQTADSRAKQTRPSDPARRSARVNSRPGDSDSPGSMPAVHFHLKEVVESFLSQPPLAGLPAPQATLQRASPLRTWAGRWIGIDNSPKAVELVNMRLQQSMGDLFHNRLVMARTDIAASVPCRRNKHVLFGHQEGRCNGCRGEFPFRFLEVDHIIPFGESGQDNIENLQLLCAHCNRVKGDWPQEYVMTRLRELGIAAWLATHE